MPYKYLEINSNRFGKIRRIIDAWKMAKSWLCVQPLAFCVAESQGTWYIQVERQRVSCNVRRQVANGRQSLSMWKDLIALHCKRKCQCECGSTHIHKHTKPYKNECMLHQQQWQAKRVWMSNWKMWSKLISSLFFIAWLYCCSCTTYRAAYWLR